MTWEQHVPVIFNVGFPLGSVPYGLPGSTRVYPGLPVPEDTHRDINIIWINPHLAPKGSKVMLYKLLSNISVRQRGLLGLQGVYLATLAAYDAKVQEIHHVAKHVLRLGLGSVT